MGSSVMPLRLMRPARYRNRAEVPLRVGFPQRKCRADAEKRTPAGKKESNCRDIARSDPSLTKLKGDTYTDSLVDQPDARRHATRKHSGVVCASAAMAGSASWHRNLEILADLSSEKIVDLSMTRNRGRLPGAPIHQNGVSPAFSEERTTVLLQVADEVSAFHSAAMISGSRMTSLSVIDSSASVRLASRTSSTASERLSRASSRVGA